MTEKKSRTVNKRCLYIIALLITVITGHAQTSTIHIEKDSTGRNAKLEWFRNARFGLFIHWDMSSIAGTEISWSRKATKPLDITGDPAGYVEDTVYDNLYKKFDPRQFNATAWVDLARKAGMKYLVFTAKHHGGFCMWDSKLTKYTIMHTPFHRDVIRELSDACHKAGLGFGIYYSQRDWHNPDYGIGDNRKYIDYMNGQLTELLTRYGKVDILWWDSYGRGDLTSFWHIAETFNLVKKLQPDILINNRMAMLGDYNQQPAPYLGDWDTPEQRLGEFQNNRPWESCMSLVQADGGGWSYRPDGKLQSFDACIHALSGCATGDGNLLLDAGPDGTGEIPADQTARLMQIGEWLQKYGVSIYSTRGGPYKNGDWGGATYKDNQIFLHIHKWTGDKLTLPALQQKIVSITNLTNTSHRVTMKTKKGKMTIFFNAAKPQSPEEIIEIRLSGKASDELKNNDPIEVARADR